MTQYTRLTIVGTSRRAEMVVPSDEALSSLIPGLMDILGETTGSIARPMTLVRFTGEQLDVSLSASEQRLEDGELVRLLRQDSTPPPPEVADVTDVLAESHDDRTGRWSTIARQVTGGVGVLALSFAAAGVAGPAFVSPAVVVGVVLVALVVAAAVVGRAGSRWGAFALTAAALGAAWPEATYLMAANGVPEELVPAASAIVALAIAWLAIGAGIGVGLWNRAALWGSIIGIVLAALPLLLLITGMSVLGVVSITAVAAVVACGLLPWYAMSASGLTGLDDQVLEGRLRRRDEVLVTVSSAYATMTWAAFAVAVPIALTAIVLLSSDNPWAVGLGAAVVAVTALRTRAFPLTAQVMALWAAVGAAVIVGLVRQPSLSASVTLIVLVALAIIAAVTVAVTPAAHQRASLRRAGNAIEAISVVAMLPVLLGIFGIYAELLAAF
ncbi:hypothetical protein BH10ACT7_BH10ACT7_06030 [soil metagenome]